jgi:hypothetical protein
MLVYSPLAYCYQSVNGISLDLAKSDYIKRCLQFIQVLSFELLALIGDNTTFIVIYETLVGQHSVARDFY